LNIVKRRTIVVVLDRNHCLRTMQTSSPSIEVQPVGLPLTLISPAAGINATIIQFAEDHAPKVPIQQQLITAFTSLSAAHVHSVHSPLFSRFSHNKKDQQATPQASQPAAMSPRSSFSVLAVRGPRLTMSTNFDGSSPLGSHPPTSPGQLQNDFQPHALSGSTSHSNGKQPVPQSFYSSRPSSSSTLVDEDSPSQSVESHRYYTQALSDEDKHALSEGEYNHNLKAYTPKDAVMHHESRKALVPPHGMDKLDKIDAYARIEEQRQLSFQNLNQKKVRGAKHPVNRLSKARGHDDRVAHNSQASQSMYDLHSFNASAPQLPPIPSTSFASSGRQTLSRQFSFEEITPPASVSVPPTNHIRAASNREFVFPRHSGPGTGLPRLQRLSTPSSAGPPTLNQRFPFEVDTPSSSGSSSRSPPNRPASNVDYFSQPGRPTRPPPCSQRPSSPSSTASSRRSEVSQHQHNPNTTFDAFLVPHKSGKGEAFQGAPNAKKPKVPKGIATPARNSSPASAKSSPSLRPLFNKLSVPKLRGRSSRRNLRKGDDDDIPDVPPLPRL